MQAIIHIFVSLTSIRAYYKITILNFKNTAGSAILILMKLYNSLTNQKEVFTPLQAGKVSMYHCGPTVYDYVHIGNLRSFLLADFIRRSFEYQGYIVNQVMNITDIGHLVSDGDEGDDKMTKALKREGKDISLVNMLVLADFYAQTFKKDLMELNIESPHHFPKASDHIAENIELIQKLEEKGYTYMTSDGVYFDTAQMQDYGKLGGINHHNTENRIAKNTEKKQSADFALWKFDTTLGWQSPWGQGFPGWHIECSGMGIKYLGDTFDIHTGGIDLKSIHHNNEIAQSECGTGVSPFVRYWIHGEMLNLKGEKLSKSTGGNITLGILQEQGFTPLDYRYLTLQSHYRSPMEFDFDILTAAKNAHLRIHKEILDLKSKTQENLVDVTNHHYRKTFLEKIKDDMNIPQGLAVFHEMMKSDIANNEKLALAYNFDKIFGLGFEQYSKEIVVIPEATKILLEQRRHARLNKDWQESDNLREKIKSKGYDVIDKGEEQILIKKQ